jgi:UDP-hydrolysing UDP-N-acetyl-D-glucosamine 2-epimerase
MARKICVVITARASYARIKSVLKAIQKCSDFELQIVIGASLLLERYGTGVNIIESDGFKVSAHVYMVLEGENPITMAKTTGIGLMELPTVLNDLKPDIVLTVADRFETIATAIASSYMNIPVAHIQGGEITGSIDEKVRHAVTKLSNFHFVANENCARRVIQMGEEPERVFVTGCPSIDLARGIMEKPELDFHPFERYKGVGPLFDLNNGYLIVMQHPVTTEYDYAFEQINETLLAIYETKIPTLWFWPNVDAGSDKVSKGIRMFRERYNTDFIHFFKNMAPEDFLKLLYHSKCIVGNSSAGIREASFLGVPSVNIGSRQTGRERGKNVIDVNYSKDEIKNAIRQELKHGHYPSEHIYGDGNAGERIANILSTIELKNDKKFYQIRW